MAAESLRTHLQTAVQVTAMASFIGRRVQWQAPVASGEVPAYHSNMKTNKRIGRGARPISPGLCDVPCFKGELVKRLRRGLPDETQLKRIRGVFAALADQQRLKILLALKAGGELCVCDVAHVLGVSVSVASHHLRKLREVGILDDRSDGRMAYYSIRATFVADLAATALTAAA